MVRDEIEDRARLAITRVREKLRVSLNHFPAYPPVFTLFYRLRMSLD
jgi:hypothetical protein